jgi:hypothetical protein
MMKYAFLLLAVNLSLNGAWGAIQRSSKIALPPLPVPEVKAQSVYGVELLSSRYASWGIDPEKQASSINLQASWENFKKVKDVVVAVIDTGIRRR